MTYRPALLFLILASCSPAVKAPQATDQRPDWLQGRPVSDAYYTGIGHGTKEAGTPYQQVARKSALEDLIAEIRVSVEATSTLQITDAGKDLSEKYQQVVRTTVAEDLEEFEQMGTYEDANNYWVWYRLSKARFREIKEARRKAAATLAQGLLVKAREAIAQNQLPVAMGFYFQSLQAIEKHLTEPLRATVNGQEIILNTTIFSELQLLLDRISIVSEVAPLFINRRLSGQNTPMQFSVRDKATGKPISDVPLLAAFIQGSGELVNSYKTDAKGEAILKLNRITSPDPEQSIRVQVDASSGIPKSEIMGLLVSKLVIPEASLQLRVKRPVIHLMADERQWGTGKGQARLSAAVRQFLTGQGFDFTDQSDKAELILDIRSDTEKGNVSGSIYISYLTASLRILSAGRAEIFSTTLDRIKGYNLDYERSAQDAYSKAIDLLEKDKLPAMVRSILQ